MVLTAGMLDVPIRPAPGLAAPTRRGKQATPGRSLPVCSRIARSSNDRRVPTHSAAATLDLFAAGGHGDPICPGLDPEVASLQAGREVRVQELP